MDNYGVMTGSSNIYGASNYGASNYGASYYGAINGPYGNYGVMTDGNGPIGGVLNDVFSNPASEGTDADDSSDFALPMGLDLSTMEQTTEAMVNTAASSVPVVDPKT